MTRSGSAHGALALAVACVIAMMATSEAFAQATTTPAPAPAAPKPMQLGDVLSGQLNALRGHNAKGKRTNVFQLTSEARRLPAPAGLCNLETGPETFEIVTTSDAQAAQLRKLAGKEVALKVTEVACAEAAGQMSEAMVTKWSVVPKP